MLESVESGNVTVGSEAVAATGEAVRPSSPQADQVAAATSPQAVGPNSPQEAARELSVKQQKAMTALAAGKSITRAAHEAGVTRRTVQLWQKENPEFRDVLRKWKKAARQTARTVLMDGMQSAAMAVVEATEAGDAYISMQLLRAMGVIPPASGGRAKAERDTLKLLQLDGKVA